MNTTESAGPAGAGDLDAHTNAIRHARGGPTLIGRILVVSVSSADLSSQYIALMNGVFAAQRLNVPIDILRLGPRTAFLQQASDATGGVFMTYDPSGHSAVANGNGNTRADNDINAATAGLLQTLLMAFLPDVTARRHLIPAGSAEVDFRAACFCHGKVVSIGGVCSVCLSSMLSCGIALASLTWVDSFLHSIANWDGQLSDVSIGFTYPKEHIPKTSSSTKEKEEEKESPGIRWARNARLDFRGSNSSTKWNTNKITVIPYDLIQLGQVLYDNHEDLNAMMRETY